jgi:opine dehydrogenase
MGKSLKVAVLGAGHGGYAMAADLTLGGHTVNLFNRSPEPIQAIRKAGGITLTGEAVYKEGFAKLNVVTNSMKEAMEKDVEVVMITVPAYGHQYMIENSAPYMQNGQIIVFNTGNWGALRFHNYLKKLGKNVTLVETTILIYSSRINGSASVFIDGLKRELPVCAFPGKKTAESLNTLKNLYPAFTAAKNLIQTNFDNVNPVFHPGITLLNAGLSERTKGDYVFYKDGVTPSVARVLQTVDDEKLAIAKALGVNLLPAKEWVQKYYGAKGADLYETIQHCKPYLDPGERGPKNLQTTRYILEDVPYGMVPMASLGDLVDRPAPVIKSIICLHSTINQTDYWKEGNNAERLGLSGLDAKGILRYLDEGTR